MRNRLLLTSAGLLTVSIPILYGQSSFEAATVKPSETKAAMVHTLSGVNLPVSAVPACRGTNSPPYPNVPLNRCIAKGHTLKWIIAGAYQVPWEQVSTLIVGGPDWIDSDAFNVDAKAESPATEVQLHSLLQKLLTEQFKLKLHREKKEMRVLAMVIAKGGPKLVRNDRNCLEESSACGLRSGASFGGRAQTMKALATALSAWIGHLVVDKTGLTGQYDFDTGPWRPETSGEDFAAEVGADPKALPTIFTALQEKLGVRLESQKAQVEVLSLIQRRSPNNRYLVPVALKRSRVSEKFVYCGAMGISRPVIRDLERSKTDTVLELLGFAAVLALIAVPAYYYSQLPDSIPQHFNFSGEPDGWGPKSSLLLTPAIGVLLYVGVTVLSRFPHVFNYPWPITQDNARRQYAISRQMLSAVKLNLVLTFSYISWATIGTALGTQKGLGPLFTIIEVPILLVILGFYLFKGSRAQ